MRLIREACCSLLFVTLAGLQLSRAESGPIVWPRVFDGFLEGRDVLLYAGAVDFSAPAMSDLDGDGDLDLLVGQYGGVPLVYRNDGTARAANWTAVFDGALGPPGSSGAPPYAGGYTAPAFADVDWDGDQDLLIGTESGAVAWYRRAGSPTAPVWELMSDNAITTVSERSRPAAADLDSDGDADLFVGGKNGRIAWYRNESATSEPLWILRVENFLNIQVGGNAAPCFFDIDRDGCLDLFVGDSQGRVHYYRNFGSPQNFAFTAQPVQTIQIPGHKNTAPSPADLDGDGALELIVGTEDGPIVMLVNRGVAGQPVLELGPTVWLGLDAGKEACPEFADIDDDGDPDLLLAAESSGTWSIRFYRNAGTPWIPDWRLEDARFLGLTDEYAAPRFVDIDSDGDLDLYVGTFDGTIRFFRNVGTPSDAQFLEYSSGGLLIDSAFIARPAFGDMDADGDVDLWIGALDLLAFGAILYYQNIGTPANPIWGEPRDWSTSLSIGAWDWPTPAVGDVNGDGRDDLVIGSNTGEVWLHHSRPSAGPPAFSNSTSFTTDLVDSAACPALTDLDGDRRLDLAIGEGAGGIRLFRNPVSAIAILPHHKTVLTGEAVGFDTSPAMAGTWRLVENRSGGTINSATGLYGAGTTAGVDVVRFDAGATSWSAAYVNVITPAQRSACGRAVVVAGRMSVDDPLSSRTNDLANFVYRMLLFRGFDRGAIQYLSFDTQQDVDGDGNDANDVDGRATLAAVQAALIDSARAGSNLFAYLVDHGDRTTTESFFYCNESERLHASELDAWLDAIQANEGATSLTLAVDCCMSGGFMETCAGAPPGCERIVIGSARSDQAAIFSAQGLYSFTHAFVGSLYTGLPIHPAFLQAAEAMDHWQQSVLDDDGDGAYKPHRDGRRSAQRMLGTPLAAGRDRPRIGQTCGNQTLASGSTQATIWVSEIAAAYPIESVWATIAHPNSRGAAESDPSSPILDLTAVVLTWNADRARHEYTTDTFTMPGAYTVDFYAQDTWGGLSDPKQIYVHQTQWSERVILVCGNGPYGPGSPWENSRFVARVARETARSRWLRDDQVVEIGSFAGADFPPTQAALENAIQTSAGVDKLTVYLVGRGSGSAFDIDGNGPGDGDVTPAELDSMLDAFQSPVGATAIVILDFNESGAWIPALTTPTVPLRVVIASSAAGEESRCEAGGELSFSRWFFHQIFSGENLFGAFNRSRSAVRLMSRERQNPQLSNLALAKRTYLGAALLRAADIPRIGSCGDISWLVPHRSLLWASEIWAPSGVDEVYAYIQEIGSQGTTESAKMVLTYNDARRHWEAEHDRFVPGREYLAVVSVRDRLGQLSMPYIVTFDGRTSARKWWVY